MKSIQNKITTKLESSSIISYNYDDYLDINVTANIERGLNNVWDSILDVENNITSSVQDSLNTLLLSNIRFSIMVE